MADITIVNGAYKPTNITGGHHPVVSSKFPEQATASDSNRPFVEAEEDDVGYRIFHPGGLVFPRGSQQADLLFCKIHVA